MESRKMLLMKLFAGQQWRCRYTGQMWTQWHKERVGQMEKGASIIYPTVCKTDSW